MRKKRPHRRSCGLWTLSKCDHRCVDNVPHLAEDAPGLTASGGQLVRVAGPQMRRIPHPPDTRRDLGVDKVATRCGQLGGLCAQMWGPARCECGLGLASRTFMMSAIDLAHTMACNGELRVGGFCPIPALEWQQPHAVSGLCRVLGAAAYRCYRNSEATGVRPTLTGSAPPGTWRLPPRRRS